MLKKFLIFLALNFLALWIGSLSTKAGVASGWYQNINKAPWTPPGWMFGVAWSTIMICFAVYMAKLTKVATGLKGILSLYAIQWILNTSWNPIFFTLHQTTLGLLVIIVLSLIVSLFLFKNLKTLKFNSFWIAPYFIWLLIATSLNAYIVFMN